MQNLTNSGSAAAVLATDPNLGRPCCLALPGVFPVFPADDSDQEEIHQKTDEHPADAGEDAADHEQDNGTIMVLKIAKTPPPPRAAPMVPVMKAKKRRG